MAKNRRPVLPETEAVITEAFTNEELGGGSSSGSFIVPAGANLATTTFEVPIGFVGEVDMSPGMMVPTPPPVLEELASAYSVVKNNSLYQLLKVTLNKNTHGVVNVEVVLQSTDRYEVYGELTYRCENDFLLEENL